MGQFSKLATNGSVNDAVGKLLGDLLRKEVVRNVMVPTRQVPHATTVMQTLIADPARLDEIDPFAPVVTTNAAKLVASLTFRPTGHPVAAVLRSCEVRAFMELVKLRQGHVDDLLLIGLDCFGRYENTTYSRLAAEDESFSLSFLQSVAKGGPTKRETGEDITTACMTCEHLVPEGVDVRLCVFGGQPTKAIWVEAVTDKGKEALEALGLPWEDDPPAGRADAIAALGEQRAKNGEELLGAFRQRTDSLAGLAEVVTGCINCYNCRVACPVCYCRECVFVTDTFRHDSELYEQWSAKKGQLRMPTDTVFYHLTRMVHMSTLCVGCGQCTSACPNDIPLLELFRTVADKTQARFEYEPGRSLEEGQPLAIFHDAEFEDVTAEA